jgi:hypothetical protein
MERERNARRLRGASVSRAGPHLRTHWYDLPSGGVVDHRPSVMGIQYFIRCRTGQDAPEVKNVRLFVGRREYSYTLMAGWNMPAGRVITLRYLGPSIRSTA